MSKFDNCARTAQSPLKATPVERTLARAEQARRMGYRKEMPRSQEFLYAALNSPCALSHSSLHVPSGWRYPRIPCSFLTSSENPGLLMTAFKHCKHNSGLVV